MPDFCCDCTTTQEEAGNCSNVAKSLRILALEELVADLFKEAMRVGMTLDLSQRALRAISGGDPRSL